MKIKKFNESTKNKEITILYGDDWEGIYLNGKLLDQNHSIDNSKLLELLGYSVKCVYEDDEEVWEIMDYYCPEDIEKYYAIKNSKKYNL